MSISPLDALHGVMADAWGHDYESLWPLLKTVEGIEDWQHPAFASEPQEAGWPLPGTIRWHVAHLAHCKRYYAAVLAQPEAEAFPPTPTRSAPEDFAAECAQLEAAHALQMQAIEALGPEQYETVLANGTSVAAFIRMNARHDTWHGGQIALIRRLAPAS